MTSVPYINYDIEQDFLAYRDTSSILAAPTYHRHNACELYLFLNGNVNYYIENSCYNLIRGDLLVINQNELHRMVFLDDSPYDRVIINIKPSYLRCLSTPSTNLALCFDSHPAGYSNLLHLNETQLQEYLELASKLETLTGSKPPVGKNSVSESSRQKTEGSEDSLWGLDIMERSLVSQLLLLVNAVYRASSYHGENIMPELIVHTMDYIETHLTEQITLDQLAARFFLDGSYISRQFKKHTGLTLRAYLLDKRILLAKSKLEQGNTVTEAALASGFPDYANFIRSFTKVTGISPGKYKKQCS